MGRESNKQRRAANEQTARERAAAMRLEQQRRERRNRILTIGGVTLGLLAVVGVIIGLSVGGGNSKNSTNVKQIMTDVTTVSDASLSAAGTSGLNSEFAGIGVPGKISDTPLTSGGKPDLLYIGAEFCPYCAGVRWPLAVSLSKFGSFSGVGVTRSGTTDGDLATLTFRNANYSSKYLAFTPVEAEDRNHATLKNPDSAQTALWEKYTGNPPGFPFIDFGGKYVATNATFDPLTTLNKLSQAQIAKDLKSNPNGDVAKAILTDANYITAAICGMTGNKPASVCTASIQTIEKGLPTHKSGASSGGSTASPAAS